MLLRYVYLYINPEEYPDELSTPFGFRTRYVCSFLERRLRPLHFHTDGFGRICVQGKHAPDENCPILGEKAAIATVRFDESRYRLLGPAEHHEFFIDMLIEGIEKCSRYHPTPREALLDAIREFRSGGYLNEWVYQKKLLRPLGLEAMLSCSLVAEQFLLTLSVRRKEQLVFQRPILGTLPDEIVFANLFKDIVLVDNRIVVRDRLGGETFSLDVRELG